MLLFSPSVTDSAMDLVLDVADYYLLTPYVYPASWAEDGALRQIISLLVLTNLGAAVLYLGLGAISYFFIFDHNLKKHPHFLEVSAGPGSDQSWCHGITSCGSHHKGMPCVLVSCRTRFRGRSSTP